MDIEKLVWSETFIVLPGMTHATKVTLQSAGSMTGQMTANTDAVGVCVESAAWGVPTVDEQKDLDLGSDERVWVRNVVMTCDDTPVLYARCIVPAEAIVGRFQAVKSLGSRPLGAFLFSEAGLRRSAFQYALLNQTQPLFQSACAVLSEQPSQLLARRSHFHLDKQRLLLTEVFLPEFYPRVCLASSC